MRSAYLIAAESTVRLLRAPEVVAGWDRPSALPEFGVHGLAGHLAWQVLGVPRALALPAPDDPPVSLLDHYARSTWLDAHLDDEVNLHIRRRGGEIAGAGPDALAAQVETTVAALREAFAVEPADRTVRLPWAEWALTLDDLLVTRMMEIAVHSDDLAASVGIEPPALPPTVLEPVFDLLTRLSVRRHGEVAVLRALTRAERAPKTIAAF